MSVCDICNTPTSTDSGGKVFSLRDVRNATDRGFNGMGIGPNAAMLKMVGITKDESYARWKAQVTSDSTDYLLCPSCQVAIRQYLHTATEEQPIPHAEECPRCRNPIPPWSYACRYCGHTQWDELGPRLVAGPILISLAAWAMNYEAWYWIVLAGLLMLSGFGGVIFGFVELAATIKAWANTQKCEMCDRAITGYGCPHCSYIPGNGAEVLCAILWILMLTAFAVFVLPGMEGGTTWVGVNLDVNLGLPLFVALLEIPWLYAVVIAISRLVLGRRLKKDLKAAYSWWIFGGIFGGHRYYLAEYGTGIVYSLTGGLWFVGWLVDLFLIPGKVEQINGRVRADTSPVGKQVSGSQSIPCQPSNGGSAGEASCSTELIRVTCPNCQKSGCISATWAGRKIRCKCGYVISVSDEESKKKMPLVGRGSSTLLCEACRWFVPAVLDGDHRKGICSHGSGQDPRMFATTEGQTSVVAWAHSDACSHFEPRVVEGDDGIIRLR